MGAFEHFEKLKDDVNTPLLMVLDVRMPGMDGKQCAQKVKDTVAKEALAREPFMVCCSAEVRKVSYEDKNGVFNIILPKPFGKKEASLCVAKAHEFWAAKHPAGE